MASLHCPKNLLGCVLLLLVGLVSGTIPDPTTAVNAHNKYRAMHSAPALVWGADLATSAQNWVAGCQFAHNPNTPYGENLWAYSAQDPNSSPVTWVDAWYAEIQYYNFTANLPTPSNFYQVGHFTQVVWKETRRVGCAFQVCPSAQWKTISACEYDPPGNYAGEFPQNVAPLTTQACPPFSVWNGQQCVCPSTKYWTGQACCPFSSSWVASIGNCVCNAGFVWNGNACVCAAGTVWNGVQCCPPFALSNGSQCYCPAGKYWTGIGCCVFDSVWVGSAATGNCVCNTGKYWTGQGCCPFNAVWSGPAGTGFCVCNPGYSWNGSICQATSG